MSKNQKLIFPSAKNWYGDGNENVAKSFIDQILQNKKYTLTKAVRLMNESYPDDQTTPQNVSNKIKRGTIDFIEVARIAEICGYQLAFIPIEEAAHEDDSTIAHEDDNQTAPRTKRERTSADNQIGEMRRDRPVRAKPDTIKERTDKEYDSIFAEAANEGCASVRGKNYKEIIFAGKMAEEAAQWFEANNKFDDEIGLTEAREVFLTLHVSSKYNVRFKLVT